MIIMIIILNLIRRGIILIAGIIANILKNFKKIIIIFLINWVKILKMKVVEIIIILLEILIMMGKKMSPKKTLKKIQFIFIIIIKKK